MPATGKKKRLAPCNRTAPAPGTENPPAAPARPRPRTCPRAASRGQPRVKLRERVGRVRRRVVEKLAGVGIQAADTAVDGAAGADGITGVAGVISSTISISGHTRRQSSGNSCCRVTAPPASLSMAGPCSNGRRRSPSRQKHTACGVTPKPAASFDGPPAASIAC